ncbi:MAG: hypothetical protein J1F35_06230 [Erysipelotrichales bacterium]|nr:hypothetical protein [Erysipelotrichales bacterium]
MGIKFKQRNKKLLKYIKSNRLIEKVINHPMATNLFYGIMDYHIDKYPHKTFGKIIIENFCDEIANNQYTEADKQVLDVIYIDCEDIMKEDPNETLKKLENKYGKRLI